MIADLTKYLTELKEEQLKKLEELNRKMENGRNPNATTTPTTPTTPTATTTPTNPDNVFTNNKTSFKLPISYVADKREINENILNDLELI